jgi:superfamily I DNA/RNA helicase
VATDPAELHRMEEERTAASRAIVESASRKRLVVAGPGTGKTFTFKQALTAAGGKGLAITFIRNLVLDLERELGAIAAVHTFHGYCKHLYHKSPIEGLSQDWVYYPALPLLLVQDFTLLGKAIDRNEIDRRFHTLDEGPDTIRECLRLGTHYDAVGHTDLVYRVLRHFETNADAIQGHPLVVVDEYQDFSLLETRFIDLIATKSPTLVAGDDDQALYSFKHASPTFIWALGTGGVYQTFELPYCSRCTAVVVEAVNRVVARGVALGRLPGRLPKRFLCYLPAKEADSAAHPSIIHAHCTVETNASPFVGRYIREQLRLIPGADIAASATGGFPTALVIGPEPFLGRAHAEIIKEFPKAVRKKSEELTIELLDGYRLLAGAADSTLGWRIIAHCDPFVGVEQAVTEAISGGPPLVSAAPNGYEDRHRGVATVVGKILNDEALDPAEEVLVASALGDSIAEIRRLLHREDALEDTEEPQGPQDAEVEEPVEPAAPELSVVCTSLLGAKGLSALHVFLVGFNDGHFPRNPRAITDDEICKFLVALSRTRKQCHLISVGRLGAQRLRASSFLGWLGDLTTRVDVSRASFPP